MKNINKYEIRDNQYEKKKNDSSILILKWHQRKRNKITIFKKLLASGVCLMILRWNMYVKFNVAKKVVLFIFLWWIYYIHSNLQVTERSCYVTVLLKYLYYLYVWWTT